jgi:DNA-directed RNA polymerase specialized sigma24 family protein
LLPVVLGYGSVADMVALQRSRAQDVRPRLKGVGNKDVSYYMDYARRLARQYRYSRPGADSADVEQEALIAAWDALERWNRPGVPARPFVCERMRWRVIDFVRVRSDRERADASRLPLRDGDSHAA